MKCRKCNNDISLTYLDSRNCKLIEKEVCNSCYERHYLTRCCMCGIECNCMREINDEYSGDRYYICKKCFKDIEKRAKDNNVEAVDNYTETSRWDY